MKKDVSWVFAALRQRAGIRLLWCFACCFPFALAAQFQNHLISSQKDMGMSVVDLREQNQYMLLQRVEMPRGGSDIVMSKLDVAGKILPGAVRLSTEKNEFPKYLQKTYSGEQHDGYIIAGETDFGSGEGLKDMFLIRTNLEGDVKWTWRYGNPQTIETGNFVIQMPDQGFVAVGISKESGKSGAYVVRTDAAGNPKWNRVFFDESFSAEAAQVIFIPNISRGGLYVLGTTKAGSKDPDVLLMHLDPQSGNMLWANRYSHTLNLGEKGVGMIQIQTPKGPGIAVTATAGRDVFTFAVEMTGTPIWGHRYTTGLGTFKPAGIAKFPDGKSLLVAGSVQKTRIGTDAFFQKILVADGSHVGSQAYAWDTTGIALNDVRQTFRDGFTAIGSYQTLGDTYVLNTNGGLATPKRCPQQPFKVTVTKGIKFEKTVMTSQNRETFQWKLSKAGFEQKENRCFALKEDMM